MEETKTSSQLREVTYKEFTGELKYDCVYLENALAELEAMRWAFKHLMGQHKRYIRKFEGQKPMWTYNHRGAVGQFIRDVEQRAFGMWSELHNVETELRALEMQLRELRKAAL
jgi:hypothetical protein